MTLSNIDWSSLLPIAVLIVWFITMRFMLPRMGIPT
jgi:hypothetical protein